MVNTEWIWFKLVLCMLLIPEHLKRASPTRTTSTDPQKQKDHDENYLICFGGASIHLGKPYDSMNNCHGVTIVMVKAFQAISAPHITFCCRNFMFHIN